MDLLLSTGWFLMISYFVVMCCFGVRYGKGVWPLIAGLCCSILTISAWFAFGSLGLVLQGYELETEYNLLTLAGIGLAFFKSMDWVSVSRGS